MKSVILLALCFNIFCNGYSKEIETILLDVPETMQHQMEIFVQKPETKQAPLLIFLHGASTEKGLKSLSKEWMELWLKKGYAIAAVSMPGYGASTGRKDFCGPFTLRSLHFAIDAIMENLGAGDFGIMGFGQGAIAGILLATERTDIRCIVSANGAYDLSSHLEKRDRLIETLLTKNYAIAMNEIDFRIRSPIEYVGTIKTPLFLLHRERNPIISTDEVAKFAEAMKTAGNECPFIIVPKGPETHEQNISYDELMLHTEKWVDAHLGGH
jgi:dipeptidyl aminopeptidase/acylaminoacyl peptidase